jgi:hypothetical protein
MFVNASSSFSCKCGKTSDIQEIEDKEGDAVSSGVDWVSFIGKASPGITCAWIPVNPVCAIVVATDSASPWIFNCVEETNWDVAPIESSLVNNKVTFSLHKTISLPYLFIASLPASPISICGGVRVRIKV